MNREQEEDDIAHNCKVTVVPLAMVHNCKVTVVPLAMAHNCKVTVVPSVRQ
mgnify:CR=1 FL=1